MSEQRNPNHSVNTNASPLKTSEHVTEQPTVS